MRFKNKKTLFFENKGQVILIVFAILFFLLVIIPGFIIWIQNEVKWSVKQKKSTTAFNLAEAGIDRGVWKIKSSTATWDQAAKGIVIQGYNFDVIYDDISGGYYRIKFSSGPLSKQVTIISEGKDASSKETRAIKAIYQNQVIPGSVISRGVITWANAFECHWGPIMAHGNINITDAVAAKKYYPRKYSRQVVSSVPSYPRDTNGLNPPNTDGVEWWSDYPVPDLPVLDFAALRSSAAATTTISLPSTGTWTVNTLNVYGCSKMTNYTGPKWWYNYATKTNYSTCNLGGNNHNGLPHFQNPARHPLALKNRTWYWDGDVIWTGDVGADGSAMRGTVIIRGNFTNYCGDNLSFQGDVPSNAWEEYQKIDTASTNQYPADNGYHTNRQTFNFGSETWTDGPSASNTDVGLDGFLYVGGNFDMERAMDYYGAVWVVGNVSRATGMSEYSIVFFKDSLDLPALNVVLVRKSWSEIVSTW